MLGLRTLVLNANYMPISLFPLHSIPAEDAIVRVCNGTCRVVAEYDRRIKTPTVKMNWPSIVARTDGKNISEGVKLRRESLFYRDHGICVYCEQPLKLKEMTLDHVIPKSKGGKLTWSNTVSCCKICNMAKGDKPATGLWTPKKRPYKPSYWELLKIRRKFPIMIDDESWIPFIGEWEGDIKIKRVA